MANWQSLLGLPLDVALRIVRTWGCEPKVLVTCAPRRKGEDADASQSGTGRPGGTPRVIRVRDINAGEGCELTVSTFPDGDPRKE